MIATSFAADTPLWVGALVRKFGVHAVWQYWAPLIGSALGRGAFCSYVAPLCGGDRQ